MTGTHPLQLGPVGVGVYLILRASLLATIEAGAAALAGPRLFLVAGDSHEGTL